MYCILLISVSGLRVRYLAVLIKLLGYWLLPSICFFFFFSIVYWVSFVWIHITIGIELITFKLGKKNTFNWTKINCSFLQNSINSLFDLLCTRNYWTFFAFVIIYILESVWVFCCTGTKTIKHAIFSCYFSVTLAITLKNCFG